MYEIVIEASREPGRNTRFYNRPTVIGTAVTREMAVDLAVGLIVLTHKQGYKGHPFEWDTISVWDTDTDQVAEVWKTKEWAEDLNEWVVGEGVSWAGFMTRKYGHCAV